MKNQNFHELQKVYMVVVLEGEGTEENIYREVKYFFDNDLKPLGKIDSLTPKE